MTATALTVLIGSARLFPSTSAPVAAAAGAALVLTLAFAAPVVIEPLFNRFTPLNDVELAVRLQAVAERRGARQPDRRQPDDLRLRPAQAQRRRQPQARLGG